MDVVPGLRFLGAEPTCLGLLLKVSGGATHPGKAESQSPQSPDRFQTGGSALIRPDDRRSQWLPILTHANNGRPLGGQRHTSDRRLLYTWNLPQPLTRLADRLPEDLGVLFGPAWLWRVIGFDGNTTLEKEVPSQIEQQGSHTLGTVVDG